MDAEKIRRRREDQVKTAMGAAYSLAFAVMSYLVLRGICFFWPTFKIPFLH